jgi:hypothetical protein
MGSINHRRSRVVAMGAFLALGAACVPAQAAISPAPKEPGPPSTAVSRPATLPAGASEMWQTNESVWSLAVSGDVLYAGGDFTGLRAPDAAQGTPGPAAGRLAAFNKNTGAPIAGFTHNLTDRVSALAVSKDGKTLYAGGLFSFADGVKRTKLAAFDLTQPGAPLKTTFNPVIAGGAVRAITVNNNGDVYIGGNFTTVNGASRANVAKLSASGATGRWNPIVDGPVNALALTGDHVWIGGNFDRINGAYRRAIGHVDEYSKFGKTTYANAAVIPASVVVSPTRTVRSDVKGLTIAGSNVYVAAEGTGTFDGTAALNATSGNQVWRNDCYGATQALAVIGGVVYDGSHAHDCTAAGAFGQQGANDWRGWHHLMALRADNGGVLDWFPDTNPGPRPNRAAAINELGPRALVTDGTNLYVGGQFSQVNGQLQQGVTRFTPSPATWASPAPVTNAVVNRTGTGRAVLRFSGTTDKDSGILTYKVYRNGTLVQTFSNIWAHEWQAPLLTYRDTAAGTNPSYRIDAIDEGGRTSSSTGFTPTTTSTSYLNAVKADGPAKYWRLDETTGTQARDNSGRASVGTYSGSLNLNVDGAIPSNKGIHLGSTGMVTSAFGGGPAANTYTVETWIRTTTKTGGRVWGMGNRQATTSSSQDRLMYMANSGQLLFGIWNGGPKVVKSDRSYNDGYWHHVVATQDGTNGLRLFVDGELVGSDAAAKVGASYGGWWRLGADNALTGWPYQPTSRGFNGDVDEFAIYTNSLAGATTRPHVSAE